MRRRVSASSARERLVHQQHLRLDRERARDLQPLAHAAGELRRKLVAMLGEVDHREILVDDRRPLGASAAAHAQREAHVLLGGEPGQERRAGVLEEHDAVLAGAAHRRAFELHLAAAARLEAGEDVEQRRLAAARGTEQADELALGHLEVDAVEGELSGRASSPKTFLTFRTASSALPPSRRIVPSAKFAEAAWPTSKSARSSTSRAPASPTRTQSRPARGCSSPVMKRSTSPPAGARGRRARGRFRRSARRD